MSVTPRNVFVTGGTGYLGAPLIHALASRGHRVRALVREESMQRARSMLPAACKIVTGDALDAASFSSHVAGCDSFVQLVGVPHPSPRKAKAFREIDLVAARAGLDAAANKGVAHFIYLSVSQFGGGEAPAMRAYVTSRAEAEAAIASYVEAGRIAATFLRPWYVLGPGHRWPLLLKPLYWLAARVPALRGYVENMGLVTHRQMMSALLHAVEHPAASVSVVDVRRIREIASI